VRIEFGSRTDRGKVRTSNEDAFAASAKQGVFLVADGMGGHAAGEVASQIAATTVEEVIAIQRNSAASPESIMRRAAQEANTRIYEAQRRRPEYAGMGSTLTVISFREACYYVAHVGDSRAYLLRDGNLEQLTRDHSLVWQLLERGVLAKHELPLHPQKNLITRSIGPHPEAEIDVERGEAKEGDIYLLCSDGLTDVASDEAIRVILADAGKTPQQLCDALVDAALDGGGPDNVTAVVVRLDSGDSQDPDSFD
jgi:PPM family protein phosphatase